MPNIQLEITEIGGKEYVTKMAYDELKGQLDAYAKDNREMTKNHHLTDSQMEENKTIYQQNIQYKADVDKIALFLREFYAEEISMGQHNAFGDDWTKAVIYYLGRERQARKEK